MAYPVSQLYVPGISDSLTSAQYNAEFQNVYTNVGKPQNIDDYSFNLAQFQAQTDPGEIGLESQGTSLSEEIERLRFAIKDVKAFLDGSITYWYQTPTTFSPSTLSTLTVTSNTNVDVATIAANIDPYTNDILTLQTIEEDSGSFNFIKCISDTNGSPINQFVVDQGGNITCGSITTTGFLTIDASSGIQADKLILAENGTGSNTITIQGPDNASTTTHTLTLPGTLPAGNSFVNLSSLGAISYGSVNTVGTYIGATGANNIRDTTTKPNSSTAGLGEAAISGSSASFSTTSLTYVDVTSLSVTLTTRGNPVAVFLIGDAGSDSYLRTHDTGNNGEFALSSFKLLRGATDLSINRLEVFRLTATNEIYTSIPVSSVYYIDYTATSGTHTYKLQTLSGNADTTTRVFHARLVAYELV